MLRELASEMFEQPPSIKIEDLDPLQRIVIRMYTALGREARISLWVGCDSIDAVRLNGLLPRLSQQEQKDVIKPANEILGAHIDEILGRIRISPDSAPETQS